MLHRLSTQIGQTETDNGRVAPQLLQYFAAAGLVLPDDVIPPYWGGALLAWAARQDGIAPPDNPLEPMSWIGWGGALMEPVAGAVVIMTEGGGRAQREIAVCGRVQGGKVYVIGAHAGAVLMRAVPMDRVIAARRPPNASLPVAQAAPAAIPLRPVVIQAPPQVVHVPAPQLPPPAPPPVVVQPSPPPAPAAPGVTIEQFTAMSAKLLEAVQAEFSSVHERIDTVERHAVAAVDLKPINE